jgi:hypothetical protein
MADLTISGYAFRDGADAGFGAVDVEGFVVALQVTNGAKFMVFQMSRIGSILALRFQRRRIC